MYLLVLGLTKHSCRIETPPCFKSDHIPHFQVTLLAALKVLGVTAGVLLTRPRTRRDVTENMVRRKRCEDIEYNLKFQIDDTSLATPTSTLEPEECFQLLFCTLATEDVKIDPDVENIHKLVTSKPGKYRQAHKFGQTG